VCSESGQCSLTLEVKTTLAFKTWTVTLVTLVVLSMPWFNCGCRGLLHRSVHCPDA
jgi:hypothetical protein